MSITMITPYLHFDGQARAAIAHYQKALGARLLAFLPQNEAPGMEKAPRDRVMHSMLQVGDFTLAVADVMPGDKLTPGDNIHVCLNFDDAADMQQKFDALLDGGRTDHPIHDTFWGARFGMLTDAYGVHWMFNCESKPPT